MTYDPRNPSPYDPTYEQSYGAQPAQPRRDDRNEQRQGYDEYDEYEEYDEYDEIDDEYPEPQAGVGHVGDAETMLRRAVDIIASA
ncbi:MAG: hypothetical protein WKF45_10350, partial [Ilumatobacteraceae bacterium]